MLNSHHSMSMLMLSRHVTLIFPPAVATASGPSLRSLCAGSGWLLPHHTSLTPAHPTAALGHEGSAAEPPLPNMEGTPGAWSNGGREFDRRTLSSPGRPVPGWRTSPPQAVPPIPTQFCVASLHRAVPVRDDGCGPADVPEEKRRPPWPASRELAGAEG